MKSCIICFFMLFAATGISRADAITFEASVNSPRVSLDQVMQLTLTITGVNDNLDPVSLPVIDGFSTKYLGPSTSVSIVNGDYHSERAFIYNLFPNRVGKFQIPAISATISGHTYSTQPIEVEVFESSAQAQASSDASDQNQAPSEESLKDKVLAVISADETDVYLNERIPLTIKLLVSEVPIRDIQYPDFDKIGVLVDDFDKPEQGSQLINGVRYDTVEFKTNIYPNRVGELTFGPAKIQVNVLYRTGQNNPFDQDNSAFGADVFNNFFDSYAARPLTVTSEPIQLHVSALPQDNRPKDFTGAIGEFDFQASVSPSHLKVGDPLTLKMDIKGSGNFKNLKFPVFQAPGFKSYAPQIKETGDEKTAEEVIIPTSTSIKEVPALQFSYFDTSRKEYKTITQGAFPIQVSAPNPEQEFKAVGFADISHEPSMQLTNQFTLGKLLSSGQKLMSRLCQSIWFWVSLAFILVAGVSYFFWRRFQYQLENDPAFARRLKAVREARQVLLQAEACISGRDAINGVSTKNFYGLLSKALRDYLANKWHQSSAALSIEEIVGHLKTAKLDDAHIIQVKTLLEQSDMVCFAGAIVDPNKMRTDLSQTQELIGRLEKQLK